MSALLLFLWTVGVLVYRIASSQCSDEKTRIAKTEPIDQSWTEYFQLIYGESSATTDSISKYDLNLLYRNVPINVKARDWGHKRPLSALDETWGDTYFHYTGKVYADNAWAEVTRYSTYFLASYRDTDEVWEEGLSRGFPGRSKKNSTKVSYGCWFNVAQGSGIYVNVGKTLVTSDKYHSSLFQDLGLTSKGCLPTDSTGSSCYDRYICTAALAKGYDSVQVLSRSELVICTGKCATDTLRYTCPPLELRSGIDAQKNCECSDESHLLNCGNSPTFTPNLKYNFRSNGAADPSRQHTLCTSRFPPVMPTGPFNVTVLFTTGALNGAVPLVALKKARDALHDKSTLLLDVGAVLTVPSAWPRNLTGAEPVKMRRGKHYESHWDAILHTVKRHLQGTPLGPYTRAEPLPPPHHDHHRDYSHKHENYDQSGDEAKHPDDQQEHHHHHHDHHHDHDHQYHHDHDHHYRHDDRYHSGQSVAPPATPSDLLLSVLRAELHSAGYAAMVGDSKTASIPADLRAAVIQPHALGGDRSVMIYVGDVRVGVIAYAPRDAARSVEEHQRLYMDEAMCLRNSGATLVLLLNSGAERLGEGFLRGLVGYVDMALSAGPSGSAQSCQGKWHDKIGNSVVEVQIDSTVSLGVVRVQRSDDQKIAISSEIVQLQSQ